LTSQDDGQIELAIENIAILGGLFTKPSKLGFLFLIVMLSQLHKPPWLIATTKHGNPPLPPFGKGGMGGFPYKSKIHLLYELKGGILTIIQVRWKGLHDVRIESK